MTVHVVWVDCKPLTRAVGNALLFVGTDDTSPAVASVKFGVNDRGLTLTATDRFRASMESVEVVSEGMFEFLLPRAAVKAFHVLLKGRKAGMAMLAFDTDAGTVHVECGEASSAYRTLDLAFPAVAHLFPAGDPVGTGRIGFNPKFLADLGKVQCEWKNEAVAILTFGETRPILAEFRGGPRVLLMPVRLPS